MKAQLARCALAGVALLAAAPAMAAFTDFTAAEGYTNGNLHGQVDWVTAWPSNTPNGFVVDPAATGYNGALGTVSMTSNWAYWAEEAVVENRGDTVVARTVFRYDAIQKIPGNENNGQLMNIAFLGGGNLLRAYLRRSESRTSDSNRSRMSFQLASNGDGGQSAIALDEHYETYTGVSATGVGLSDWLEFTASLMRGKTRNDWKLEVVVRNLATDEVCIAGRWKIKSSSDFFNDTTLVARISGEDDANNHIVAGSREIDSFEVYAYHQYINYDEVCDGNIDGAKSKAEETSTANVTGNWTIDSADLWGKYWGYIGGAVNFCGSVGHDKYGKFGSHKDTDAAVTQTGRKWYPGLGRAILAGETIEWSVNYRMTAAAGLVAQVHMDLYLTANGVHTTSGGPLDPSYKIAYAIGQVSQVEATWPDEYLKMLGVRISQSDATAGGNWPDGAMAVQLEPAANYAGIGPTNTVTGWVNLNDIGISAGDPEGDHLKVTYRAKKTDTHPLWDCSMTILNRETGAAWTFTKDGMSNAPLYDAGASIYPTIYDPKGFSHGSDGFEFDDLICRILYDVSALPLRASQIVFFDGAALDATVDGNSTVASLEYVDLAGLAAGSWSNMPGTAFTNDTGSVVTNTWPIATSAASTSYRVNSER